MSKLERLLNLTLLLLETERPLTIEDIRSKIPDYPKLTPDTFRRTFERDKDDLREMGIPVELTQLPGGDQNVVGYRIRPDDYYLPELDLTPDEISAIQLALATVEVTDVGDGELGQGESNRLDALRKLGGAEQLPATDVITSVPLTPSVSALFQAVVEHAQVSFAYGGAERTVDPWRLEFQRGHWYLTGFDHLRGGERHYRVDRMESDITIGAPHTSTRPDHVPGVRLTPWQLGEGEPVTARIEVDESHVGPARSLIGDDAQWEPFDGGQIATISVTNIPALRALVLDMLDHATLASPEAARADLVAHLRAMLDHTGPA